ncbi:hypothetical protein NDU88_005912 [Pleurodeles waltl]|uniref:Uncharacterized protein n=1 Tax=Pleurodeles waltl TaxID=8319 RepID=A0AAV7LMM6_PLEWA|nr:hypothetical protein NDU88_005912 [Pleurodeles waltl]
MLCASRTHILHYLHHRGLEPDLTRPWGGREKAHEPRLTQDIKEVDCRLQMAEHRQGQWKGPSQTGS